MKCFTKLKFLYFLHFDKYEYIVTQNILKYSNLKKYMPYLY